MSWAQEIPRIIQEGARAQADARRANGTIWGSTLASLGQIPQLVQQAKTADQERQVRSLELDVKRTQLASAKRTQQHEDQIAAVFAADPNPETAIPKVMAIDPQLGMKFQQEYAKTQSEGLQLQDALMKLEGQKASLVGQILQGSTDQESHTRQLHVLKAAKLDTSSFSGDYEQDKPLIESKKKSAVSVEKAADDARMAAAQKSLEDHQRALEKQAAEVSKTTAADKTADNARLDAAAIETARNHRAMESAALIRARRPSAAVGGAGGEKLTPDAVSKIATAYNLLGIPAIPTRLSDAEKIPILNEAAKQDKAVGRTPAQAVTRQLTTKADAGALVTLGKLSSSAEAFESKALGQVGLITDLSQKVSRTKWPIVNGMIQSGRERITGDEDATKLANAISTFSAEYAKIMEGSTGSVAGSSDSSRKAAERLINTSMSKGTMAGVLDLMKQEMRLTIQGYDTAKEHITTRISGTPQSQAQPAAPKYRFNPATGKIEPYQ